MATFRSLFAAASKLPFSPAVTVCTGSLALYYLSNTATPSRTLTEASAEKKDDQPSKPMDRKEDTNSKGDTTLFEGCLQRQIRTPQIPYPAWDYNWDDKMTSISSPESVSTAQGLRESKAQGKTRHIILVRHGQYDETHKEDGQRILTPLGRRQAVKTGQRLAILARGGMGGMEERFDAPCNIKAIHQSDMARAKETASLIASWLPGVPLNDPDPRLNEGIPAPMIPLRPDVGNVEKLVDDDRGRIEEAFQKYIYRSEAMPLSSPEAEESGKGGVSVDANQVEQEFEVIVCHGNVIRYFFCRALQLPPEAWLRLSVFNCSLTYLMIHPNGYVQARMLGDVGHLDYDDTTFSGSHGFNW
jgi:serine/threonine-protein phosphatase PGAM5